MPKLLTLGQRFEVSKSFVLTMINTLIYNLCEVLQELVPIATPPQWTPHMF
jgi:hypothetical protein